MWERQHEHAADKIYSMCSDMGGFFLKVGVCLNFESLCSGFMFLCIFLWILKVTFNLVYNFSCVMNQTGNWY